MPTSHIKSELISLDSELAEKESDILVVLPISFHELLCELERSRLCSWGHFRAFKKEFSTALDGLISAQYQEELLHFQKQLLACLNRMKLRYQKYNLKPEFSAAQHCLSFLYEVCELATPNFYGEHLHDYENLMFKFECLRQRCPHEQQDGIQEIEMQIFTMLREGDVHSFALQRKLVEHEIRAHPAFIEPRIFNVSSLIGVVENHIQFFVDIRRLYLPLMKTLSQRLKKYQSLYMVWIAACVIGVAVSHHSLMMIPAILLLTLAIKLASRNGGKVMRFWRRMSSASVGR